MKDKNIPLNEINSDGEYKARHTKSDTGALAFAKAELKDLLGLSDDTVSRIMQVIRSRGELATLRTHVKALTGRTWRQANIALDQAEAESELRVTKDSKEEPKKQKDKKTENEKVEAKKPEGSKKTEKSVRESAEKAVSFIKFLTEFDTSTTTDDATLKSTAIASKQELLQQARKSPQQRAIEARKKMLDMQRSKDPLERQEAALQRQLAMVRKKKQDLAKKKEVGQAKETPAGTTGLA